MSDEKPDEISMIALAASFPAGVRWIDINGVAAMLQCKKRFALEQVVCKPGFPKPSREIGRPRWKLSEIQAFGSTFKLPRRYRVECERGCSLYRHFDSKGNLLYVGISLAAAARQRSHARGAHWFHQVTRIDIEWFESRKAARAAELGAIKKEKPHHNIAHKVS